MPPHTPHPKTQSYEKLWELKGNGEACPGACCYVGNFGNFVHTFSHFDVDILSSHQLREGGDCPVLLLGPVEEVLVAMGERFLLDLAGEGEVSRLKVDLRALRYLQGGGRRGKAERG